MGKIELESSWKEKLIDEFNKEYMHSLRDFLKKEKSERKVIFPPGRKIFSALNLTSFQNVKAVILGQDPYHGSNQAHGLSFSVEYGIKPPPSLNNIFKELASDLNIEKPNHGNLEEWGKQGVLLLNSILTVEKSKPGSHANRGWEVFTDKILFLLNSSKNNLVFILWGKKAQEKGHFIDSDRHMIIKSTHPSPYSANNGFLGSKPFSKTNSYLKKHRIKEINWNLS
ncbi:MAG: uracil-DNA glycosylase [Gammaproteobacteria bacterium]|nr:MAG: uracil-DNA glycosylase [Gammaproteobacteria bacterium]|tara:strand:- start:4502 stop:5179 length:678 start_codon:yes stop_codon:yes gene_type:complete